MSSIFLKSKCDFKINQGYQWVFSNQITTMVDSDVNNGSIVSLFDSNKKYIGDGFYNKHSLISFRLLSDRRITDLKSLFSSRLKDALNLRKSIYPDRNAFRLVFGESDFLPGLIVDKYNDTYVLQVNSYGIENNINLFVEILIEDFSAKNVFTKNEIGFREKEGLLVTDSVYFGEETAEIIDDGKIKYKVDFSKGQKTGFYFDQFDNRYFVEKFCKSKKVLDGFCNLGGFGLHAKSAGASQVDFLDSSSVNIGFVMENLRINSQIDSQSGNYSGINLICKDAFEYLKENKTIYDVVMLDPPAFVKNKKSKYSGLRGYEKLNRLGIRSVINKGILVTSSCSYHVSRDEFLEIVNLAAINENRKVRLIYERCASSDHPILPSMPETNYLKFMVFYVE